MRTSLRALAAGIAVAASWAAAQTPAVLVLTRMPGPPASALFTVDPATGAVAPLGGFAGDTAVPLAVEWDSVNGDVLVAVQDPAGSRILRLGYAAGIVVRQTVLAVVPGPVARIHAGYQGTILVVVDGPAGGLYSMPRHGGTPVLLSAQPYATAFFDFSGSSITFVARSPPAADPVLAQVILPSGTLFGTYPIAPGLTGRRITGTFEGLTAITRFLLTDDLGGTNIFIPSGASPPVIPWILQPPLPAGGAVSMKQGSNFQVWFLGGPGSPFLRRTNFWGPAVTVVAGPLPGSPVDCAPSFAAGPATRRFGVPCGGTIALTGPPQIGNASLAVSLLGGPPLAPAVLALGLSDQTWGPVALPLAMPGGCSLLVSADLQLWVTTDAQGSALVQAPVPNNPALAGVFVFGQWVLAGPGSLTASDAISALLGP